MPETNRYLNNENRMGMEPMALGALHADDWLNYCRKKAGDTQ